MKLFILLFFLVVSQSVFGANDSNITACSLKAYIYTGSELKGKNFRYESNIFSPDVLVWDGGRCEINRDGVYNLIVNGKKYIVNGYPSVEAYNLKQRLIQKSDNAINDLKNRINQLRSLQERTETELKIKGKDLQAFEFEVYTLIQELGKQKVLQSEAHETYYVSVSSLNVRTLPSTKGKITDKLSQGREIRVYELKNGWARLTPFYDDENGPIASWASANHLSKEAPIVKASEGLFSCEQLDSMIGNILDLRESRLSKEEAFTLFKINLDKQKDLTSFQRELFNETLKNLVITIYDSADSADIGRRNREDFQKALVKTVDSECN